MAKGKAPKQKESQAEKFQAQRSLNRLNEWKSDGFRDLETRMIDNARIDQTASIERRGKASLEGALYGGRKDLAYTVGQGTYGRNLGEALAVGETAETDNRVNALTEADQLQDTNRIQMAKVGQDVALTLDSAYGNAANRGAAKEATRVNNNLLRSRARTQAIVDTISGAATGAMLRAPAATPKVVDTSGGKQGNPYTAQPSGKYMQSNIVY
tara:strand:+ start:251 stop:886 length:636 start_codon:yes stop_codon:yes gene_type:complete